MIWFATEINTDSEICLILQIRFCLVVRKLKLNFAPIKLG